VGIPRIYACFSPDAAKKRCNRAGSSAVVIRLVEAASIDDRLVTVGQEEGRLASFSLLPDDRPGRAAP
jgi:hypothetical protein